MFTFPIGNPLFCAGHHLFSSTVGSFTTAVCFHTAANFLVPRLIHLGLAFGQMHLDFIGQLALTL